MFEGLFKKKASPKEEGPAMLPQQQHMQKFPVQNPVTGEVIGMAGDQTEAATMIAADSEREREAA